MLISRTDGRVTLEMDLAEAGRLGAALLEGPLTVSRAEFFIRTGVAAAAVQSVADAIRFAKNLTTPVEVLLPAADEETENPRRPRPEREPQD
ncbi:hypothetical protein VSH64_42850 [Amycolatopsis rhabdoformis]|uniref:Uncharacterized protein n=1 Tax=Amycolatopsis rhabdoformis TaxID=1448059 RepID=A0ABZ1I4Z5_9PSEU|nr:hypothetical protein [Amycolatopsis rhabdoformis]WSE29473.1 hypothetical protein VSH64_42850 [Amycolatopsis rhabdoformis]